MTSEEQVVALKARHAGLEGAIEEEIERPRPDNVAISQMKREKLRIKDELAVLVSSAA